jgi:hypothetical protein
MAKHSTDEALKDYGWVRSSGMVLKEIWEKSYKINVQLFEKKEITTTLPNV